MLLIEENIYRIMKVFHYLRANMASLFIGMTGVKSPTATIGTIFHGRINVFFQRCAPGLLSCIFLLDIKVTGAFILPAYMNVFINIIIITY